MKKLLSLIFSILFLTGIGFSQGKWRYNPFTGERDYYVEGLSLSTAAAGDIIYYNGTIWTRLAKGTDDQVLTLAAGLPSWAAAAGGADVKVGIDVGATAGYLGAAYSDGVLRVDQNELTYTDGGNFITLGLADHDTARTALGLAIGTDVQASDASLTSIAGLTYASGSFIALTAEDIYAVRTYAQTLSDIGGQASDAGLTSLAGLTYASDSFIKVTAEDTYAIRTLTETASDLEASIESAIDTLANLISVQGHTFTLAGNFVTQNNNVTINAVTAARTVTLNESLTIGDGNDGTLTYSGASKTLTVADDCTVNQDLQTTDDVQHADIYHTGFVGTNYYDCGNSGASITIDWNNGNLQHVTLTAVGVDITFTEPPHPGECKLWIIQDGTGSRTVDWEHEISPLWPGGVEPTLTTTAAAVDIVVFTFIGGTTYRGLFNGDFK